MVRVYWTKAPEHQPNHLSSAVNGMIDDNIISWKIYLKFLIQISNWRRKFILFFRITYSRLREEFFIRFLFIWRYYKIRATSGWWGFLNTVLTTSCPFRFWFWDINPLIYYITAWGVALIASYFFFEVLLILSSQIKYV